MKANTESLQSRWMQKSLDKAPWMSKITDLDMLLRSSDYVSRHLPLNDKTRGMFDAESFANMKPGAIFFNTARRGLVNERALANAIGSGYLAGAGLNTFHEINVQTAAQDPPLQPPMLELESIAFSPRVGALSEESARDVERGVVENLAAVLSGRWPVKKQCVNIGVVPRFPLAEDS